MRLFQHGGVTGRASRWLYSLICMCMQSLSFGVSLGIRTAWTIHTGPDSMALNQRSGSCEETGRWANKHKDYLSQTLRVLSWAVRVFYNLLISQLGILTDSKQKHGRPLHVLFFWDTWVSNTLPKFTLFGVLLPYQLS